MKKKTKSGIKPQKRIEDLVLCLIMFSNSAVAYLEKHVCTVCICKANAQFGLSARILDTN